MCNIDVNPFHYTLRDVFYMRYGYISATGASMGEGTLRNMGNQNIIIYM